MKPTSEILERIEKCSSEHKDGVFTRIYRYLLREDIYYAAYRDILYIRHIARYCQIVTKAGKIIQDERGIKKLFEIIEDERFIFIDRGAFINLDYIQKIENGEAVMINGDSLPISRRLLPQVKLTIWQYMN